jgi:hypothetical protein
MVVLGCFRLTPVRAGLKLSLGGPPKQYDFRNFLMSQECAEMAQTAANLA